MTHPKIDLDHPRLEVIVGCMFSGKTEELLARLRLYEHAFDKVEVILFRPERDTRLNETHAGREFEGVCIPTNTTIDQLIKLVGQKSFEKFRVIGFDEGNFFDEKTFVQLCEDLVKKEKIIIVSGLDMTFSNEGYGPIPRLMELADILDKNQAVCTICRSPYGTRTQRLIDGRPAGKDSPRDIVGDSKGTKTKQGVVTYIAVCRKCYKGGE